MNAVSTQSRARPVRRTAAESAPGLAINGNASGNTAISPGFSASFRSPSLSTTALGWKMSASTPAEIAICRRQREKRGARRAATTPSCRAMQKAAASTQRCLRNAGQGYAGLYDAHPLSDGKYNGGLDRPDRNEEHDQARQHAGRDLHRTFPSDIKARFRGTCYRLTDDMTTERGVVISGGSGLVTR